MITFLVHPQHRYTVQPLIDELPPDQQKQIRVCGYFENPQAPSRPRRSLLRGASKPTDILDPSTISPGDVLIFADLERLNPAQIEATHAMASMFEKCGVTILNRPARYPQRYEFLRSLYQQKVHAFNTYRVIDVLLGEEPVRYPVFIRNEREHAKVSPQLFQDRQALFSELATWVDRGICRENKIIIEWADTRGPDQCYRKYAA